MNELRRTAFHQGRQIDRLQAEKVHDYDEYSARKRKLQSEIDELRKRVIELQKSADVSSVARTEELQWTLQLTQTELEQMKT